MDDIVRSSCRGSDKGEGAPGHKDNSIAGMKLRDKGGSCRRLILECWRNLLLDLVVTSKTVNPRFNKNQAVLSILVFPVDLEMLANGDGFLDEMP